MADFLNDIKKMAEQGVKDQALQTLKTDGFEIECSNCKHPFTTKEIMATCPNCSKVTEVVFNFN